MFHLSTFNEENEILISIGIHYPFNPKEINLWLPGLKVLCNPKNHHSSSFQIEQNFQVQNILTIYPLKNDIFYLLKIYTYIFTSVCMCMHVQIHMYVLLTAEK